MGTRSELERLANFVVNQGISPIMDSTMPLADARQGFEKMAAGDVFGKVVFTL
jgi:D-arabinose 1-dehydrogenase-like Zn-dependent alcohol dehydrogenase